MPTLTWTGEIMPIKQGGAVMITSFGGFGYIVLLFVGFNAPAWMDAGLWKIHELLCGCKSFFIRLGLPVAAEKRRCLFSAL